MEPNKFKRMTSLSNCYYHKQRKFPWVQSILKKENDTSSNGTKMKGVKPLVCETAGTSGLCVSSSCHPSTISSMSSSLFASLSLTPLVTSETKSILLLAPAVVPLSLKQSKSRIGPKEDLVITSNHLPKGSCINGFGNERFK